MKKKIFVFLLVFAMCFCSILLCTQKVSAQDSAGVTGFVERLYEQTLQREGDADGLNSWVNVLTSGKESGAKVAQGFIDSNEFKSRNLSDEDYITILYRTFFDREPDTAGLNAWIAVLNDGLSRLHVFKGFAESDEFTKICNSYGIIRGNAELTAPMDQNEGVAKFIVRCYRLCLGREADEGGLNSWCTQILSGANTAKEAAYGFVFSNEFQSKNLSNEDFVKTMYRVFMDREADSAGLSSWMNVLAQGQSRWHVFNGFADSIEFQEICNSYGINSGSGVVAGSDPTPEDTIQVVAEYTLPDSIGWYTNRFIIVKNNYDVTLDISTSSVAYDINGNIVAADNGNVQAVGAGCTSIIVESFETNVPIGNYQTEISIAESIYDSVIQNLSYVQNNIDGGAVFQVTNNGTIPAEFVEGYALFFKGNQIVDYDWTYFTDNDYEIKPGSTISEQMNSYEDFDRIEFFVTGRKSPW